MSADVMTGVRDECMEAGMNDFITKPIEPKEVFEMVAKWVKAEEVNEEGKRKKEKGKSDKETELKIKNEKLKIDKEIEIPKIEGIDIDEGLRRVGGNRKLFLNLLEKFYKSNVEFEKEIRSAVEKSEEELSIRLAHTLKGVSGNLGAATLFLSAKKLEQDLAENKGKEFEINLEETVKNLDVVLNSIKDNDLIGSEEKEKQPLSNEELIPKLKELKSLLEDYDSGAADKIKEIGLIEGREDEMKELEKKVSNYECDEAVEIVGKIIKNLK